MKKVSIKQAIVDAIEMSEPAMGRHMNFLIKQAKYIEREIGSVTGHPVVAKAYTVTGNEIIIPDDCYQVLAVLFGNHENECNIMYRTIGNVVIQYDESRGDDDVLAWIPMNTTYVRKALWREYGDVIHLVSEYEGAELTVIYQKTETDPEGMWIVNDSHVDAITKFLIYKYAKKHQFKVMMGDKMIRASYLQVIMDFERDYNIAVRNARATDCTDFEKDK